jgi:hypothetical protein
MPYDRRVSDRTQKEDRAWYRLHPHRQHRIRPIVPGETGFTVPAGWGCYAAVCQIQPGVLTGIAFAFEGEPSDTEDEAAMIYAHLRIMLVLGIREAMPAPWAVQPGRGADDA